MKLTSKIAIGVAIALLPLMAFAAVDLNDPTATGITNTSPIKSLSGTDSVLDSVTSLVNWIITLFWILTVGFMMWAAFLYLTAGGDDDKIKEAKGKVMYALIAAAVALLSTGLSSIATSLLKGGA